MQRYSLTHESESNLDVDGKVWEKVLANCMSLLPMSASEPFTAYNLQQDTILIVDSRGSRGLAGNN
jgi:hypothetical protein